MGSVDHRRGRGRLGYAFRWSRVPEKLGEEGGAWLILISGRGWSFVVLSSSLGKGVIENKADMVVKCSVTASLSASCS